MKTKIFGKLALVACSALVISACNDSERIAEYYNLTLDKNEAVFDLDNAENLTAEFNITEGNGNYKVSVEDAEVAEVSIDGTKITVTALRVGETTAKVYDWVKQSAEIRIKVIDKFELSDSDLEMLYGEIRSIEIYSGNGDYQVASSNEEVATVVVEGGFINITAVGAGEADVTVTDAEGKTTTIKVIVSLRDITFSEESPLEMAMSQTKEIEITSGNGGYTLQNSEPTVVKAELTEDGKIKIESLKDGVAELTVTDQAGVSAILTVNVKVVEITLEQDEVTVNMNKTAEVEITGGNGEYSISSNTAATVATAEIIEGNKIKIIGLTQGEATITITDKANKTKELKVTVGVVDLQLETTEVEAIETSQVRETKIRITDGNGGYTFVTSHENLIAEYRNENGTDYIILKPKSTDREGYNLTATVTDAAGKSVTITVHIMHRDYLTTMKARYFVERDFRDKSGSDQWNKKFIRTIDKDGEDFRIQVYTEDGSFSKTYEGWSVWFKYPEEQQPDKIEVGDIVIQKVYKQGKGWYDISSCSDAKVDKVTTDGNGNVNGVWLSFQEAGIDARSYVICVK